MKQSFETATPAGGDSPEANNSCNDVSEKAMNSKKHSTDAENQRQRILCRLFTGPLTTTEARTELDIMHPGGRVLELRKRGHNIQTHWEIIDTGKAKHKVASYVLFNGVYNAG